VVFKWFRNGVDESSWTLDAPTDVSDVGGCQVVNLEMSMGAMAFEVFAKIKGVSFRYHLRKYAHGLEVHAKFQSTEEPTPPSASSDRAGEIIQQKSYIKQRESQQLHEHGRKTVWHHQLNC
jgi:hypothetical protein